MTRSVQERFNAKFTFTMACWLWHAAKNSKGYGQISLNKKQQLAHRVSYEISHGPIPNGLMVLHRCDTRNCVNPDHLFVGTAQDNTDDMMKKARHKTASGESHPKAILTRQQAANIKNESGSQRMLAKKYGVSRGSIFLIKKGVIWK